MGLYVFLHCALFVSQISWKLEVADSNDEDLNKQRSRFVTLLILDLTSSIIMFLSRWFETSITDFQAGTLTLLQQFLNLIPKSCKILLKTKLKQVTQVRIVLFIFLQLDFFSFFSLSSLRLNRQCISLSR